jgi:hypothetical protein
VVRIVLAVSGTGWSSWTALDNMAGTDTLTPMPAVDRPAPADHTKSQCGTALRDGAVPGGGAGLIKVCAEPAGRQRMKPPDTFSS